MINLNHLMGHIEGFKLLDSDLKCRNMIYKIGEVTIYGDGVNLSNCGRGLYYYLELSDIIDCHESNNVFCKVLDVGDNRSSVYNINLTNSLLVTSLLNGKIQSKGSSFYFKDGRLHRIDGPAAEYNDGNKKWYINGKLHRTDGPAVEIVDGIKEWYINGKLYRTDGPAVEWDDGTKQWYINDKLHRIDGPASELPDGNKYWFFNDELHRIDGPAEELADGTRRWYINGILHRIDDPEEERSDVTKQ